MTTVELELIQERKPRSPCDEKLDRLAWTWQQSFEIGGLRFGVRTTSEQFGSWIQEHLSPYRLDREEDPLYSIVMGTGGDDLGIRGKSDYHILYTGIFPTVRTLELASLGYAFLCQLETHLPSARSDLLYLDGTVVAARDRIALLPGLTLPELTKLGRSRSRFGLSLSPVMTVAVDPDTGKVVPLPNHTLSSSEVSRALQAFGSSGHVGDLLVVREPITIDVIGTWDSRRGRAFEPMSRGETLHHLVRGVFNRDEMGSRALMGLGQLVAGADCYGLVPKGARPLAEWLAGPAGRVH